MADRSVDAHFREFAASGDPAALAAVFDALAGDLLLVAAHVAWSGTDAQDLVQATFLTAIEARASFAPDRPVRPWLIAILVNHARSSNRRSRRTTDPTQLRRDSDETIDPATQAESREVIESVAMAIESMPEHYRQVLHLRLLHQLELAQIASALGIPLATAKSRLLRGTERLQRALPTGVAGAVLAATTALTTGQLAAMRQTVLAAVPAGPLPPASLAWSKQLVLALTVVPLAAVALAIALWPNAPLTPELTGATGSALVASAGAPSEPGPAQLEPAKDTAALAAAARVAAPPPTSPAPFDGVTVRGRLVDPATGGGLPGILIVRPTASFVNMMLVGRLTDGNLPGADLVTRAATDGSGRFELRFAGRTGVAWQLLAEARDRVRTHFELGVLAPGLHDVGDIAVASGTLVRFAVVDEHQLPVADARLRLAPPGEWHTFAGHPMGAAVHRARADAAGEFELRLSPGPFELQNDDDHRLVDPRQVLVETAASQRVTVRVVRLRPAARIKGRVIDAAGRPLAGIEVVQFGANRRHHTDSDGRFEYDAIDRPGVVTLLAEDLREFQYEGATTDVRLPWNGDEVLLQMHRVEGLRLQVVRASTGEPVERFAVVDFGSVVPSHRVKDHPGGRVVLPAAVGRTRQVLVLPSGDDCAATSILEFPADERQLHRIALRDKVAMQVRLVDADDRPVAGSTVELLDPMGQPISGLEAPVYPDELSSSGLRNQVLVLADGESDATGRATLRAGRGHRGLALRVQGPDHVRVVVPDVVCEPGELRVRVVRAGTVAGELGPAATMRMLHAEHGTKQPLFGSQFAPKAPFGVFLTRDGERLPAADRTYELTADGEFQAVGVPAGTWQVHLSIPANGPVEGSAWSRPIGTVDALQAGATRRFQAEIDSMIFGHLTGSVQLDDRAWAGRTIELRLAPTTGDPERPLTIRVTTDAAGRFERNPTLVGSYSVAVSLDPARDGRHGYLELPQTIVVSAGRTTAAEFVARRRTARVRLLTADGTPVAGCHFQFRRGTVTRGLTDARTDGDGWFTLDPVPYGPFELVAIRGDGQQPFALELPPFELQAEWQLRLP